MISADQRRQLLRELKWLAVVLLAPACALWIGARVPHVVRFNLGPGDAAFISGFAPEYEIENRIATHWTTYDAAIELPLTARGPVSVSFSAARVLPQTAVVDVLLNGNPIDHFTCRGGTVFEREVTVPAPSRAPLRLAIRVDSHDRKNRGLKMDWVQFRVGPGLVLRGAAISRVLLVFLFLWIALRIAGWTVHHLAFLLTPAALLCAGGLLMRPWMLYRMLTGVPEALALLALIAYAARRYCAGRGDDALRDLRYVAALSVAAFIARALLINHPDFYYPDLRTHASLVGVVRAGGLDFFVRPAHYIWEQGLWKTEAYGQTYAFPYSPAFHLLFVFLPIGYDGLLTAMKVTAAAISVVPLILVWILARRLGVSIAAAVLMALVPTYTSRLSFAFLPSLFGHAFDIAFIVWLAYAFEKLDRPAVFWKGVLGVVACQLAYVYGILNTGVWLATMALLVALLGLGWPRALAIRFIALAALGGMLSIAFYYRDFLDLVWGSVLGIVSGQPQRASHYPIRDYWDVIRERTYSFFGWTYPLIALAGLALLRKHARRVIVYGWLGAYLLLLLGRAKMPDLFTHGHETLFATPLMCLLAGAAIGWLWNRGQRERFAAWILMAALAAQGLFWQWRSIADQLSQAK